MGLFGCLGRVLALVALLAILGLAWLRAPDLWERVGVGAEPLAVPSPGLVAGVEDRFSAALAARDSTFVLSGPEATALLHAQAARFLPEGVAPGAVDFPGGAARVSVLLDLSDLSQSRWSAPLKRVLPATVPVTLQGVPLMAGPGEVLLLIRRVSLAGIPIPRAVLDYLTARRTGDSRGELPFDAIRLPLPPPVSGVYIADGVLILSLDL